MAEKTDTNSGNLLHNRKDILLSEYKLTNLYSSVFGMYVFPKLDNIGEWHGFLLIKEGIYENSKIKFVVTFPDNFPKTIPDIKVLTKVYHPMIDPSTGKLDLQNLIPIWNYGEKCQILDMLMKFKNIFRELDYLQNKNSFNPDAANLFDDDPEKFLSKVEELSKASVESFGETYEGCPYKNTPQEMPDNIREILEDEKMGVDERKQLIIARIRQMISQ